MTPGGGDLDARRISFFADVRGGRTG